eukprot:5276217-Pleurochrysis_carterae.AAC.1
MDRLKADQVKALKRQSQAERDERTASMDLVESGDALNAVRTVSRQEALITQAERAHAAARNLKKKSVA